MLTENFIFQFLGFIALNLVVLGTTGMIAIRLLNYKLENLTKFTLSTFLLTTTQILLTQITLGSFSILNYTNVWMLNLVIFVITLATLGKKILKNTKLPNIPKFNPWPFLIIFTPFITILLLRYTNALFQIPLEYDNVAYHLPFVVEWFKSGNLLDIYYSAYAGPLGYYPSNYELLDLWVLLPFGKDYLINFINLPIFPLLILAIYATARNLKLSSTIALITTGLFIYMPQTFRQIGVPLVDAFFTLTFVTSIYFLQEFWKTKSIKDIFLFSISAGIFIGTKYLGVPYIFPLALIAIIITWLKFKNKKTFAISTTVMGITTFITGGFFYIRNWLDTGNPLFPVEVNLLGQKIFEGYHGLTEKLINYSLLKNVTSLETFKEFLYGFFLMTGLPSILIFIASISLLGIFIISIIKKKKAQIAITGLAGSLLLFYLFFYFKSPYTYNNLIPNVRYAMMFLLIGCLTVGYVFSNIKKIKPILFPLSMIIFITNLAFLILKTPESIIKNDKILIDYEIFTKYPEILAIALAIMILFIIMLISASLIKKKKYRHIVIGTFISIIILSTFLLQETIPQKEAFTQHYAEFWHESQIHPSNYEILTTSIWLDKAAPKENIAYTGFNFHYHLFGRDLQREVDYININECAECKYFDYKDSPESIRRDPNYENWIKNLESKEKEYLIIAPNATEGVKSWEYEWVEKNPTKFTKVHETKEVKVYKIN